jgi:hypothetical protein
MAPEGRIGAIRQADEPGLVTRPERSNLKQVKGSLPVRTGPGGTREGGTGGLYSTGDGDGVAENTGESRFRRNPAWPVGLLARQKKRVGIISRGIALTAPVDSAAGHTVGVRLSVFSAALKLPLVDSKSALAQMNCEIYCTASARSRAPIVRVESTDTLSDREVELKCAGLTGRLLGMSFCYFAPFGVPTFSVPVPDK